MRRVVAANGVVYLESERLREAGVRHAFSTRIGGVSPAPYDSLNLGNPAGVATPDPEANLTENYRRLAEAAGLPARRAGVRQVHGCGVALLGRGYRHTADTEADAIVSDDPEVAAVIRVADCAAVLAASADGSVIAVIHAGWRGVVEGAVTKALETMAGVGKPARVAAVFPCISYEQFEVGPEVVGRFEAAGLPAKLVGGTPAGPGGTSGKGRADVAGGCVEQLRRAGVTDVDVSGECTFTQAGDYFSHRRATKESGGVTGRMALLAVPAGRAK